MEQTGQDVTRMVRRRGGRRFSDGPEFFMASEGKLTFANGAAAMQGIDGLKQMIKRIELRWGKDLKIDALSPELAVVGTSWEEEREDAAGMTEKELGGARQRVYVGAGERAPEVERGVEN